MISINCYLLTFFATCVITVYMIINENIYGAACSVQAMFPQRDKFPGKFVTTVF